MKRIATLGFAMAICTVGCTQIEQPATPEGDVKAPIDPGIVDGGAHKQLDTGSNTCFDEECCFCGDADRDGYEACVRLLRGEQTPSHSYWQVPCEPEGPSSPDCNDFNRDVNPGELDVPCDGQDTNCDGFDSPVGHICNHIDPPVELDWDRDGFLPADGDCDNQDPNVYPGAPEAAFCDGIDSDCSGLDNTSDGRLCRPTVP